MCPDDELNEAHLSEAIRHHTSSLLDTIDPWDIIGALYQDHALSDAECEQILNAPTRRQRAWTLLSKLRQRDAQMRPFSKFIESLRPYHSFIVDDIEQTMKPMTKRGQVPRQRPIWKRTLGSPQTYLHGTTTSPYCKVGDLGQNALCREDICRESSVLASTRNSSLPNLLSITETDSYGSDSSLFSEESASEDGSEDELHYNAKLTRTKFALLQRYKNGNANVMTYMPSLNRLYQGSSQKQMASLFDQLITLIDSGQFEAFRIRSLVVQRSNPDNLDLKCMTQYLDANSWLFQGELGRSKRTCKQALKLVPYTRNPSKMIVDLLFTISSVKIRMNKFNDAERLLADALMIIAQDPTACAGKAAGWVHYAKARQLIPLISTSSNLIRSYSIRQQAMVSLEKALEQFNLEVQNSGDRYGFHVVSMKLASLQLACGDLMQTVYLQPTAQDIADAEKTLKFIERDACCASANVKAQLRMTLSDLCFRQGNYSEALAYAENAHSITHALGFYELNKWARARITFHTNLIERSVFHNSDCSTQQLIQQQIDWSSCDVSDDQHSIKTPLPPTSHRFKCSSGNWSYVCRHFVRIMIMIAIFTFSYVYAS